ncbi:MAG: hypothetical protein JHC95_16490 [Solirubrobacteraceae bacterium]|nr:hypothetical protein [Solirubrobacteraceae bacterium]
MDELEACERGLRRAGLPLLIEDYSAYEDVFTRAVPLLALVFVGQAFGAIDLTWDWWANLLAVLGGVAILLGAVALLNRRDGRPALSIPTRVGPLELALFVLVPALLPLVFGGQWRSAVVTAAGNLILLGVIWAVVGYGVLSIVTWSVRRLVGQLATSFVLLARAVPLLLVFSIVLFVNAEMWQVFSSLDDLQVAEVAALFVAVGLVFVVARVPREVREIERQVGEGPPLRTRQLVNVGLVLVVAQGLQVLTVAVVLGGFFVAFGWLAIEPAVIESWIGSPPEQIAGTEITVELLRVSGALAAFSGLYYAIAVLTDGTYREEFLEELTGSMRDTFRLRARYLALRGGVTGSAPAP